MHGTIESKLYNTINSLVIDSNYNINKNYKIKYGQENSISK